MHIYEIAEESKKVWNGFGHFEPSKIAKTLCISAGREDAKVIFRILTG